MQKLQSKIGDLWAYLLSMGNKQVSDESRPLIFKIIEDAIASVVSSETENQNSYAAWLSVEEKLTSRVAEFPELFDYKHALVLHVFTLQAVIKPQTDLDLVQVCLSNYKVAVIFMGFLWNFLPIREQAYPHHDEQIITLTSEQFYFCNLYLKSLYAGGLAEIIADHYLLKSLRSDNLDFSHQFIKGIIPGKTGTRHQNLRPYKRGSHTTTHERKRVERLNKTPMYSSEIKKGFSQIQSTTFVDEKMKSCVFGVFKQRTNKLYGLMTHCDDALMNRLLTRDCGTVSRPFDVDYGSDKWNSCRDLTHIYSPDNIEEFKKKNLLLRESYGGSNEVLARLRFNPYRTIVCIFANTLEARLLAYSFAEELLEEFGCYAKELDLSLNPNYRIPIVFYLPEFRLLTLIPIKHELSFYTESMREADLIKANNLYNNIERRNRLFNTLDYEFLLGLPSEKARNILMEPLSSGEPLALAMIKKGYIRMLMRLLKSPNHAEQFFDGLLENNWIEKNSEIIGYLVCMEAFNIASKLIHRTQSDIMNIRLNVTSLFAHIIYYGTPRQIQFVSNYYEAIIFFAASSGNWHTLKLYLKETSVNNEVLLKLLFMASEQKRFEEAKCIITQIDIKANIFRSFKIVVYAALHKNWKLVSMISERRTDPEDSAEFGVALILALNQKEIDVVRKLLDSGAKPPRKYFFSENYCLCSKGLINLIEFVSQHEMKESLLPYIKNIVLPYYRLGEYHDWVIQCCKTKQYLFLESALILGIEPLRYSFQKNDPLISELIIDEQFKSADIIINGTDSNKLELTYHGIKLVNHIIAAGKYSHFSYMGVNNMLLEIARQGNWEQLERWLGAVEVTQGIDRCLFGQLVNRLCYRCDTWKAQDLAAFHRLYEKYLHYFNDDLLRRARAIVIGANQKLLLNYLSEKGADRSVAHFFLPVRANKQIVQRMNLFIDQCEVNSRDTVVSIKT